MKFVELKLENTDEIREISNFASKIVKDFYDPILGAEQNDYMIEMFQSPKAIENQLKNGYQYFIPYDDNNQKIGFIAVNLHKNELYLSKFYIEKSNRHKGNGRIMMNFVKELAKNTKVQHIRLNVNKYNSAVKAYESYGFKKIRDEKNDIGSGYYMDDYVYQFDF